MVHEERLTTRGRKYDQVLEGAGKVFMQEGYAGSSVDEIARAAKVSKATLYSYFPDKRLMFVAVFRNELARTTPPAHDGCDAEVPIVELLTTLGRMILGHMLSDRSLRVFRMAVAESARFEALAREYQQCEPKALRNMVERCLRSCQKKKLLRDDIADIQLAADTFIHLNSVRVRDHALMLGREAVDAKMMAESVDNAVRVFLRAYGSAAAVAQLNH